MRIIVKKSGTLQTAQLLVEKTSSSVVSECVTRSMTTEDWEKYGPLKPRRSKKIQK